MSAGMVTDSLEIAVAKAIATVNGDEGTFRAYLPHARAAIREPLERAAEEGYRTCAETRHITLGDKVANAIRSLASD